MKCTMDQHDFVGEAGHDWVLVAPRAWTPESGSVVDKLLWACPCDEFKWTSYAEWAERQTVTVVDDKPAENPEEAERRREELRAWHKRQYEERKKRKLAEGRTTQGLGSP